ncbi:MAG TPA: DUF4124 domain-containing protein [Pseudomonadales bacterium]|nr:DUF4124 domain-containing protein [Pseudomonadales bacterium]
MNLIKINRLAAVIAAYILTMAAVMPCHAELYKWVDEQGRTHYGDKPDKAADKASVVNIPAPLHDTDDLPAPAANIKPRLIIYTRELPKEKRAIGSYHFGTHCLQAMPIYWPDAYNFHPDLVPDGGKTTEMLMQTLGQFGYPLQPNLTPDQFAGSNRDGLLLTTVVTSADIKACTPRQQTANIFLHPENVLPIEFDRAQITLSLDWELATPDGKVIYRGRSSGKSGSLTNPENIITTWREAITEATVLLLNDKAFQAATSQALPAPSAPVDTLAARKLLMRNPQQHLSPIVVTALPLTDTRQQMGVLRAGQFCRNTTPLQWPDIRNLRASLAPDTQKISNIAAKSFTNFDYTTRQADPDNALATQRRIKGLLLQMQVSRLYLEACAPETYESSNTYGPKSVTYSSYKRYQLQLNLDWILFSSDGTQLFTTRTESNAGNLQVNGDIEEVYSQALDQSVMQLLSNAQFQQALNASTLPAEKPASETPNEQPATGLLDSLKKLVPWLSEHMSHRENSSAIGTE